MEKNKLYDLGEYTGESGGIHGLDSVSKHIVTLKAAYGSFYPYCSVHGFMLKVSPDGIWRCADPIHHGAYYNNK